MHVSYYYLFKDDVMLPNRVLKQYETAISLPNNMVGLKSSKIYI